MLWAVWAGCSPQADCGHWYLEGWFVSSQSYWFDCQFFPQQKPPSPDYPHSGQNHQTFPALLLGNLMEGLSLIQAVPCTQGRKGHSQDSGASLSSRGFCPSASVLRPEAPARLKARALATELLPQGPWPQPRSCCHSSVRVCFLKRLAPDLHSRLPLLHAGSSPVGGVSS